MTVTRTVAMTPLAIIGWMHPVLAEVAMATSSNPVVGKANCLRKEDIRPKYLRDTGSRAVSSAEQWIAGSAG